MANAVAAGITIVAIAGNGTGGPLQCAPGSAVSGFAREPGVIAVAAHMQDGSNPSDYQYGSDVDISAPHCVTTDSLGGGLLLAFCGTSAAAPHVAGVAALLVGAGFSGPNLIIQRITETALDRGATGKDDYYGWGTIRARNAVVARPTASISGPGQPITQAGTYTFTAQLTSGAGPVAVKWQFDRSDTPANPDDSTGFGSASYTRYLPPGEYSVTLTATPRETVYLRIGFANTITRSVCTGGALRSDPAALARSDQRRRTEEPIERARMRRDRLQPRRTDYGCGDPDP